MKKNSEIWVQIKDIAKENFKGNPLWKVFEFLKSQVWPNDKVMIALSGWSDSILTACLVYNFYVKQAYSLQNLFFIHCDHATRPGNVSDASFVQHFVGKNQYIFVRRKDKKLPSESNLRTWRYQEFAKAGNKYRITYLILGHNLNDRVESTVLNLLRGAGLNGFISIQQVEDHHLLKGMKVLRPILELNKAEVLDICQTHHLPFVTDPTNTDTSTSLRNTLRNDVFAQLFKLSHKQTKTSNSFLESMKQVYTQLETNKNDEKIILNPITVSPYRKAKFAYQRATPKKWITMNKILEVFKQLWIANNVSTPLLNEWMKFLKIGESGYKEYQWCYGFLAHGKIYFIAGAPWFWEKRIDKKLPIHKFGSVQRGQDVFEITPAESKNAVIRFPQVGDRYLWKSWNSYCSNQKIPIFWRNFVPLLVQKGKIVKVFRP